MNEEKNGLIPEEAPPKTIVQSAKDFMNGVLSPLKGKDVGQLVEEFTAEMTLVAEGLSEDQQKLQKESEALAAQQTLMEQNLLDQLHDANVTVGDMQKEIDALRRRLEKAEKSIGEKKIKKVEGFTGLLRQATWLAGIVVGGWIIVTVINFFK
ncbi:MAG: hypothetical protein IJ662_03535 [Clostridia bacterium]|nr:hypothetical protein [Clostridia bacterium]